MRVADRRGRDRDRQRRHDGGLRGVRAPVHRPRPARARRPRADARDDLLSRRPLLAAGGGAVGPRSARPSSVPRGDVAGRRVGSRSRVRVAGRAARARRSGPRTPCALVEQGFRAVKVRIARDRVAEGIAVVAAMRARGRATGSRSWSTSTSGGGWPATSSRARARPTCGGSLTVLDELGRAVGGGAARRRRPDGMRAAARDHGWRPDRRAARWRARFEELLVALERDALDVYQPDVVLSLGHLGRAHARRSGAAPQSLVHPPHLDQRHRPARQPPRLLRRRRGPVPRVPLRPARLDAGRGGTSCSRRRCGWGDGCLAVPAAPGSGRRARRGGGGLLPRVDAS